MALRPFSPASLSVPGTSKDKSQGKGGWGRWSAESQPQPEVGGSPEPGNRSVLLMLRAVVSHLEISLQWINSKHHIYPSELPFCSFCSRFFKHKGSEQF